MVLKNNLFLLLVCLLLSCNIMKSEHVYKGYWVEGEGDTESLYLIDKAFESMDVSAEMTSLAMFYKRDWDGFVLSNTAWPAWWIQNTFGPSYSMMPFLEEPYRTWIKHAQGLWFLTMADGEKECSNGYVAPDGCLCDCALIYRNGGRDLGFGNIIEKDSMTLVNDGSINKVTYYYRQGDGEHETYDWPIGFCSAGLLMECERLLIDRNILEIKELLPKLKRTAAFIDSRRDPKYNLIKGGKGSNLLAPSFEGITSSDIENGFAYLSELSVNYCAVLQRLAELCKIIGEYENAENYLEIANKIQSSFHYLLDDDQSSFVFYRELNGVKHGSYGADRFGYFETTPNHDAVCMRVVDDAMSNKIVDRMLSIQALYPHDLVITNYPAYNELGYPSDGLMSYGTWVHGGHWSTCQGRMNIACLRVNQFEHPFKSWKRTLGLMQNFRADAPLGNFGGTPWADKLTSPHNTVFDCWGVPGGLVRGLFEYDYRSDCLRIRPHLPNTITRYIQKKAVVYGETKIYLTVTGSGEVSSARINEESCEIDSEGWVRLANLGSSKAVSVEIICGNNEPRGAWIPKDKETELDFSGDLSFLEIPCALQNKYHVDLFKLKEFYEKMLQFGLENTYECSLAKTALKLMQARYNRILLREKGKLPMSNISPIPSCDLNEVEKFYAEMALNMAGGLTDRLAGLTIWKTEKIDPMIIKIAKEVDLFPVMRTK